MANDKNILMVEGEADRSFFEELCNKNGLNSILTVAPPKSLGGTHNTKQGVLQLLPTYLNQLADGQRERLGIVIDADQAVHGSGYLKTLQSVSDILQEFDFSAVPSQIGGGLTFKHNDGLADFGLWIMPNNSDEGILENWINQCIHPDQASLFSHATTTVAALPDPLFKPIRKPKAEIATWLAWQDKPGEGLYYCIQGGLLNTSAPLHTGLVDWLKGIFS